MITLDEKLEVKKGLCMWCKGECGVLVYVKENRLVKVEEDPKFLEKLFHQLEHV